MTAPPQDRTMGVWTATALVVGGMIGGGVYVLPAQLAPFGIWSVAAWITTLAGSLVLAMVFIALHRAMPEAESAVALVEIGLGRRTGMLIGWSYWLSIVATNAVLAMAAASYASALVPVLVRSAAEPALFAAALIAAITALNILGTRIAGWFQLGATVAKLIPLVASSALLLWLFATGEAAPQRLETQIGAASPLAPLAVTMFALLGFEAASVAAARVRNPERNVPRAMIAGLFIAGALYMVLSIGIALAMPARELAASSAPFALLFDRFAPGGSGTAIAACAAFAALGALNGWVLLQGEVPRAMAASGTIPAWFDRSNRAGVPVRTMLLSSALAIALVLSQLGDGVRQILDFTITLTTATSLWLYLAVALAALRRRVAVIPAVLGLAFSVTVMAAVGWWVSLLSLILMLSGLPFYRREVRAPAASGVGDP